MQHVHHSVDPGHIERQTGDHLFRPFLKILVSIQCFKDTRHCSIDCLIRHGNRLMHSADRAGRMKNDGLFDIFIPAI